MNISWIVNPAYTLASFYIFVFRFRILIGKQQLGIPGFRLINGEDWLASAGSACRSPTDLNQIY